MKVKKWNLETIPPFVMTNISRSSRSQMFFNIGVPKNFANCTGKHLCSFSLCSGAQGEYAGLMAIRSYLVKNGQEHRTVSKI